MASSSAHHRFLLALAAFLAVAAPRAEAWGGGRLFFSKTTRPEAAFEPVKAAGAATTAVPDAADPNSAPAAFSRPSTSGTSSSRGYGLYGRPEENYPPAYFRRGVHRNAEKLTTTTTNVPTTSTSTEEAVRPVGGGGERAEPLAEDNGSGRGRPPWYYPRFTAGGRPEEQRGYGMSDTRLYQNGRYYYDANTGTYGYGRESNPVRTRPEEFGSGFGRAGAGAGRGRYGGNAAAGYEYGGNGDEFGNGVMENQNGFQEDQNEQSIP